MRRGNCDLLTVLLILCACHCCDASRPCVSRCRRPLGHRTVAQMYPGLLGVGLAGLRRLARLCGLCPGRTVVRPGRRQEVQRFARNCTQYIHDSSVLEKGSPPTSPHPWSHSIPENWHNLWRHTPPPIAWLALIEGHVAAALLLVPLLAWTSFHVFRSRRRKPWRTPF